MKKKIKKVKKVLRKIISKPKRRIKMAKVKKEETEIKEPVVKNEPKPENVIADPNNTLAYEA